MDLKDVYTFCTARRLGVLSSLSPDRVPQSALVGIAVTEQLEVIFDTVDTSRKYRNLVGNPNCAFVIGWEGETTVQYEGIARLPVGEELDRYRAVYFKAWPDGPARLSWPGLVHFVVKPIWVRYSDFDQRPPLIQEFRPAA